MSNENIQSDKLSEFIFCKPCRRKSAIVDRQQHKRLHSLPRAAIYIPSRPAPVRQMRIWSSIEASRCRSDE